jgi:mTERF domain-containing protein
LALKNNAYLLYANLDKVINPNVVFLRRCGLCDRDIAKLCSKVERMLTAKPECLQEMAACAEGIGVPRGSGMFKQALQAVVFLSREKITAKVDYLKKTFRWSDAEVSIALTRAPMLLRRSKDMLQRRSQFLISEVGLEPVYIARRPVIICLSLEGRLNPRHYVLKFLKENGILDRDWSFSTAVMKADDVFVKKYICPHKEAALHLAEDYAAACMNEKRL